MAEEDAYAGLLVSMHTYNLLTERADRSTIQPEKLHLLDRFLEAQREFQEGLQVRVRSDRGLTDEETSETRISDHFRLLQATDNLSLLSSVGFTKLAT